MPIFKFRVMLDFEESVFRDIEIRSDQSFFDLHNAIIASFGFKGDQMASFYMSNDDWDRGEEIPLMEMAGEEEENDQLSMRDAVLGKYARKVHHKMVYIYDFLRMWAFYIELMEIRDSSGETKLPKVVLAFGEAPNEEDKDIDFEIGSDPEFGDDEDDDDDYFGSAEDEYLDPDDFPG